MNSIPFDQSILPASTFGDHEDVLFWTLITLTVIFTTLVLIMVVGFSLYYRRGARVDRSNPVHSDHRIEVALLGLPLLLGLVIFVWGARLFADVRQAPPNAEEVFVIGKRWMWHTQHMNGTRENNELHVPIGKPIKLTMISQDVIHDFWVPAFRIHQDVIPGHYTSSWFQATRLGKFHLFCAQYCGTDHSQMVGAIYVMKPDDYAAWLRTNGTALVDKPTASPVEEGGVLFQQYACNSCHGAEDTVHGPTLVGIYGTDRKLTNGSTVTADSQYLRESIVKPWDKLTAGYGATMPEYPVGTKTGDLSEENILSLIAYIKSLGPGNSRSKP